MTTLPSMAASLLDSLPPALQSLLVWCALPAAAAAVAGPAALSALLPAARSPSPAAASATSSERTLHGRRPGQGVTGLLVGLVVFASSAWCGWSVGGFGWGGSGGALLGSLLACLLPLLAGSSPLARVFGWTATLLAALHLAGLSLDGPLIFAVHMLSCLGYILGSNVFWKAFNPVLGAVIAGASFASAASLTHVLTTPQAAWFGLAYVLLILSAGSVMFRSAHNTFTTLVLLHLTGVSFLLANVQQSTEILCISFVLLALFVSHLFVNRYPSMYRVFNAVLVPSNFAVVATFFIIVRFTVNYYHGAAADLASAVLLNVTVGFAVATFLVNVVFLGVEYWQPEDSAGCRALTLDCSLVIPYVLMPASIGIIATGFPAVVYPHLFSIGKLPYIADVVATLQPVDAITRTVLLTVIVRVVAEIVAHAASAATLGWCMLVSDNAVHGSARTQFAGITVSGGPSPATPNILAALKDYNGRATFFVTLANAQRHTGLLMAIVEDGHSIGIQGTCESDFMGWESEAEARAAKAFLNSKGISVHYYRPPICGTYSPRVARAVAGLKLKMVYWNVYPWDFVGTPAEICGRLQRYLPQGGNLYMFTETLPAALCQAGEASAPNTCVADTAAIVLRHLSEAKIHTVRLSKLVPVTMETMELRPIVKHLLPKW